MSAGNVVVINRGDMSSSITPTTPLGVHHSPWVALHFVWTGTPTGSFVIEASNDWSGNNPSPTWEDTTSLFPGPPALSGSAGSYLLNITGISFAYMRISYVATSGAGTLTVTAQMKGF